MKKRHLTKDEILSKMKQVSKLSAGSYRAPFTGMATLCNYVLWKKEEWGQKRLGDYNNWVAEYERRLDAGEVTMEDLSERLFKKGGFKVEYIPWTDKDITTRKGSFAYDMEKRIMESQNMINELSTRYMTIHFNVMIDLGYGPKRLGRNKDDINRYLGDIYTDEGTKIMQYRQELIDKVGIFIEMPNVG